MDTRKAMLVILDGWGIGQDPAVDAIAQAETPNFDQLWARNPHATLITYGKDVGLPDGQMGNSEVGHLNIGAGRIVYQSFARINKSIEEGAFTQIPLLRQALLDAKNESGRVHLLGLVSDGGVHSHINHLLAICDLTTEIGNEEVYIHAFTDGRDVSPKSGAAFIQQLEDHISSQPVQIASITGRYYAMDRDTRWERIAVAYNALVKGVGESSSNLTQTIKDRYQQEETDEFLKPIINEKVEGHIRPGDTIIFFNFRTDRPRQLTRALALEDFPEQGLQKIENLNMLTMTQYDEQFQGIKVIFEPNTIRKPMGQVVSEAGLRQLRIAETEKYAHVTFFFNGGEEEVYDGEHRILIDSPRDVDTYDQKPEMSAYEVTTALIEHIQKETPDFICVNYANTDMVGHTGDFEAAKAAAHAVDDCLGQLIQEARERDYETLIIADHGNSDIMITPSGEPHTAHTTNPVPIIYVGHQNLNLAPNGKLGDIAPTLLKLMQLDIPSEMTGSVLTS
ncbi:MAG: 2,3-bisphosphoglycerate-independent phosphoglycerate mutase [Bacteroidota bacterium]